MASRTEAAELRAELLEDRQLWQGIVVRWGWRRALTLPHPEQAQVAEVRVDRVYPEAEEAAEVVHLAGVRGLDNEGNLRPEPGDTLVGLRYASASLEAERLGYKLTVFQNSFSQPEQDRQVQQYIASGAKPAVVIFWPWVAEAALNDVRQLSRIAPVIFLTQEPNEASWPYVKAYSGANQVHIGEVFGRTMIKAREAARAAGMELKSPGGNLLVFQHPEGEKTGTERMKGFLAVTKDEPFNIIHTEFGSNSPETGYKIGRHRFL